MSFLFVSHSSADKVERVRPLVEVLLAEGELVWIDRPGVGDDGMGFDRAFIERHGIDYLQSGRPWSTGVRSALKESSAVIGCLSRAVVDDAHVLKDELTFADVADKLVVCVVDDLPIAELPRFQGLLDLSGHQVRRIDCARLREALQWRARTDAPVEALPAELRTEWERVRHLIADVDRIRPIGRPLRPADVEAAVPILEGIPVGPILHVRFVPVEIIEAFCHSLKTTDAVESALSQAETLIMAAFPAGFTERQILLNRSQLPPWGAATVEGYWTQAFALAGMKARRTLAALLLTPVARGAIRRADHEHVWRQFLSDMAAPNTFVDLR